MPGVRILLFVAALTLLSRALAAAPATCTPRSMGEKWEQRFATVRARNQEKAPDIVFFGESLVENWNLRPEFSPLFKETFGAWKTVNLCSGGEHPQTLLWKLTSGQALQGIKARLIVLNIGGDNRDSAPDTVAGISNLLATLGRTAPGAKILLLPPMRRGKEGGTYWQRSEDVAKGMAGLADGKGVFFVDLETALADPRGKRRPELFEKNSFAFNAAGYREAGKVLAKAVKDILGN